MQEVSETDGGAQFKELRVLPPGNAHRFDEAFLCAIGIALRA